MSSLPVSLGDSHLTITIVTLMIDKLGAGGAPGNPKQSNTFSYTGTWLTHKTHTHTHTYLHSPA